MKSARETATFARDPTNEKGAVAVLAVSAGEETYGFPLSTVREIVAPPPVAEVPRAAPSVMGVISVRGQIITLVDLCKLLNLGTEQSGQRGRVLLIDSGEELIGVAVDRVLQVFRLDPLHIEYASTMGTQLSDYIVGIGRVASAEDNEQMLILVDPVSLLGG